MVGDGYVNIQSADTNKYMMYDFYILDYLNFLVQEMSPKQFRDLSPDMEDSVKDAVAKLFPHLREELLNSVFYAICAEMRNTTSMTTDYMTLFPKGSKERRIYFDWLKYMRIHRGSINNDKQYNDEDLEVLDSEKPSSDIRPPELEGDNTIDRNLSFKAANYSIKKNGVSRKEFVEMATRMFYEGNWSHSYGGPAWGRIGKGWLSLYASDKLTPRTKQSIDSPVKPMSVAIDHVYDLQHNTDTVFNKLKSYYSSKSGYGWLKTALDHKANVKSYHDLLKHASGSVKSMALPVLYNRLGTTWEQNLRDNRPEDLYDHAREEQKQKDEELEAQNQSNVKMLQDQELQKDETVDKFKIGDSIECIEPGPYNLTQGNIYKVAGINNDIVYVMDDDNVQIKCFSNRFKEVNKIINDINDNKINSELDQNNVNVGDILICINSRGVTYLTKDKEYKVIEVYPVTVGIIDDIGEDGNYYYKRFKKKEENTSTEYTVEDWNSGDILECLNNNQGARGELKVGERYALAETPIKTSNGVWYVKISERDGNPIGIFKPERFKNITLAKKSAKSALTSISDKLASKSKPKEMSPKEIEDKYNFKVGDIVKHKDSGFEGKVVKFFDNNGVDGIDVIFDDDHHALWKATNAVKKEEPKKVRSKTASGKIDMKFKDGEKVKCVSSSGNFGLTLGKDYVIDKSYNQNDRYYVEVANDYGTLDEYFADRFKKIEGGNTPKKPRSFKDKMEPLKVGDEVTMLASNGINYDGTIKDNSDEYHYKVLWDDTGSVTTVPKSVIKKKGPKETLNVGDDVAVWSNTLNAHMSGTLKEIDIDIREGAVEFPNLGGSHTEWFPLKDIKKETKI